MNLYNVSNDKAIEIGVTTFSELNYKESDIEELLRRNIDMKCDEEESMLIVAKQVRNAQLESLTSPLLIIKGILF